MTFSTRRGTALPDHLARAASSVGNDAISRREFLATATAFGATTATAYATRYVLHVRPGATFWNDWTKLPFSMTNWNMRPLGVQVLALAYRLGEAWNESASSNPEVDSRPGRGACATRSAGRTLSRPHRQRLGL